MAAELIKPRLLFISPVFPSPDGPGLAMRPYSQIVNLSRNYSIHLLVAGITPERPPCCDDVVSLCDQTDYIYGYRFSGKKLGLWNRICRLMDNAAHFAGGRNLGFAPDAVDYGHLRRNKTLAAIAAMKYERVHVFRLYMASVAEVLKERGLRSFYSLDCDDIESETRHSIAELFSENGDMIQASRMERESKIYDNLERRKIPGFDRIFVCSRRDGETLQNRFPDKKIAVLPNVAPAVKEVRSRTVTPIFTMLFVGTMGYYPNADAVLFFARRVVPILREKSAHPWILRVVGTLPDQTWIKQFESIPEIKFSGWVADLACEYAAADLVVAPIRGGGGTRIKILEAFAHGVPVVSTSKGAEGLEVESGVHLLIADDASLFARACIRLMKDRPAGDELSRRAISLVASKYGPDTINRVWAEQSPEVVT